MMKFKFTEPSAEDLLHDKDVLDQMDFSGTQPSPEDDRDYNFNTACVEEPQVKVFPEEYMLDKTEILNQSSIGSCVAHACATALASGEQLKFKQHNIYSRGYIYGNRLDTDTQSEGMIPRQAIKQLHKCGDVLYDDFPYNMTYPNCKAMIEKIGKEELAVKALSYTISDYFRCYTESDIKGAIMTRGGVLICVPVYTDFSRDLHQTTTKKLRGYHEMIIIGWTKDNQWIVQNSWGEDWGYDGCLLMDFNYPVSEYWAITINMDHAIDPIKKRTFWQKLGDWFKGVFVWISNLFKKKN